MTYFCTRCKLTSEDGNRWCQEIDCPAGASPRLFQTGDTLGTLTILNRVRVLPISSIYVVEWDKKRYFMKIANPGADYEDRLKDEASALKQITLKSSKRQKTGLPRWVQHPEVNPDAFGIVSYRDEPRVYFLMEYVDGTILYDYLLDNPQPWHKHVGWFLQTLARGLMLQHSITDKANMSLNPETILVYKNNANVPQPLILDLGLLVPFRNDDGKPKHLLRAEEAQWRRFTLPAYLPPVLLNGGDVSVSDDLFVIGLIGYEMLAGRPTYPYERRPESSVRKDIASQYVPSLNRTDLPRGKRGSGRNTRSKAQQTTSDADIIDMRRVIRRALSVEERGDYRRYPSIHDFVSDLSSLYGPVLEKRRLRVFLTYLAAGAGIALAGGIALSLIWSLFSALLGAS